MAWDFLWDPVTQDLVDDGHGGVELTETAETAVLHQLLCHRGEWWGDPEAGSRLHDLDAFAQDPEALVPDEVRRALEPLVRSGRIDQVRARAVEVQAGRVVVETSFQDASASQRVDLVVTPSRS